MLLANMRFYNTVNRISKCGSADERSECSWQLVGSSPKRIFTFNVEDWDSIRLGGPMLLDQQLVQYTQSLT
jgi:hypothetical protein